MPAHGGVRGTPVGNKNLKRKGKRNSRRSTAKDNEEKGSTFSSNVITHQVFPTDQNVGGLFVCLFLN